MSKNSFKRAAAVAARVGFVRKVFVFLAAAAALTIAAPAAAAVTLQTSGTTVTGATGVEVGGFLYNVTFQNGSCASLFGGCDQSSDFTFNTQATGDAAIAALISQVLTGLSGTQVNGCTNAQCTIYLPTSTLFVTGFGIEVLGSATQNFGGMAGFPTGWNPASYSSVFAFDTTNQTTGTFARFTATGVAVTAAVPEPATWAMMLLGFGGIGMAMRRKRSSSNLGGQYA